LAREQVLALFGAFALGDVDGHAADPHDAAMPVGAGGRRADAPPFLAIRSLDPEPRLIGAHAAVEMCYRLLQLLGIVGMQELPDIVRRDHEGLRFDAEDPVLAVVPHPVAIDPVPIPRSHLAGGNRHAAALLALDELGGRALELGGTGA